MNFVAAMVQGHPYWQNEKHGNSSWRKLCFICYQNANHEMLCKSQHCLSYVENVRKFWSVLIWRLGWYPVVQFCMPLMSLNILCRCQFCTTLSLCISYILHKELSIAKWIWNVSNLRYLYTKVIRKQQSPSLWIDTGFDWNLGSFPSWRSADLMEG